MEPANSPVRPEAIGRPAVCLWCRETTSQSDVVRNRGLCHRCVHDNVEISWRLVYDRDRKIGSIPANLRVAYGL